MKSLKQQFKNFRETTPKHVQWLLLGAAFVVVIILLTLILGHKSNNEQSVSDANVPVDFKIDPTHLDFVDIEIGSYSTESVDISVNAPVVIEEIKTSEKDITTTDDCEGLSDFCEINVTYKPTSVHQQQNTVLKITWHVESQPDILNTEEVSITYSSWKKEEPVIKPEPIVEQKPEPIIEEEDYDYYDYDEDDDMFFEPATAIEEVREVATPNPFKEEVEEPILAPEKCSDFAIPGYDQSGRQIGWIKPEHGANYFHPFSDKDCSNPTGKYDFTTGIITSLSDGSKIGTDSDHIGYRHVRSRNITMPRLSTPKTTASLKSDGTFENGDWMTGKIKGIKRLSDGWQDYEKETLRGSSEDTEAIISSRPYDRTFILRQFKPIPATIVSEVRADPSVYGCNKAGKNCDPKKNYSIPVRATVDRNVYSDDGRTIMLPTGTLLLGYLDGELPGPYQAFGRMNIKWYQFIRPDGVEFNFKNENQDPYSADAQGRMGVPGHGSTDYVEQMVMPILTALVPAAVNMIAPITDTVINQIDLDNNTIVQSGTIRSSEMAKQDIINTWNKITQKLLVDAIDNTVPPFSIAAGTRINVFSPVDLIVTCGLDDQDNAYSNKISKKCAFVEYGTNKRREWSKLKDKIVDVTSANESSWVGQVRSFNLNQYCAPDKNGKITIDQNSGWAESGYDYRTVLAYCESQNYQAKNNVKQEAYNTNIQQQSAKKKDDYGITQTWTDDGWETSFSNTAKQKAYNEEVLGLSYDDAGNIKNPFAHQNETPVEDIITCDDGLSPDLYGCCTGETYTDMGPVDENDPTSEHTFACCPDSGGDCFPPIQ